MTSLYLCLYYNIINAWSFWYLFHSFQVSCWLINYFHTMKTFSYILQCIEFNLDCKATQLLCFVFSTIPVSAALGRMPHQFQPDRTYRGVWKSNTHPVFLLQGNTEHLAFYWREWRHSYGPGTVPLTCLDDYLPVHCPRSKVNWKSKKVPQIANTGSIHINRYMCIACRKYAMPPWPPCSGAPASISYIDSQSNLKTTTQGNPLTLPQEKF